MAVPRLITPDGETIKLSRETYRQIRKLLGKKDQSTHRSRRVSEIRATYGKFAGEPSLVQALLVDHAAELAREDAKLKRLHG